MDISISTNLPPLHSFLNSELPEGVKIVSEPPIETRGAPDFNIDVSIDIKLVVDLTEIASLVFATWLIKRVGIFKGNHKININGKQIPVNKPDAIELITKEIEHKQNKENEN